MPTELTKFLERIEIELVALLLVVDGFTGKPVLDGAQVTLLNPLKQPVRRGLYRKANGVFALVNLAPGSYTATVKARHYVPVQQQIRITRPREGDNHPVETICLQPDPGYPFPAGTALVRGTLSAKIEELVGDKFVSTGQDRPVPQAEIEAGEGSARATATSLFNGRFTLFFKKEVPEPLKGAVRNTQGKVMPGVKIAAADSRNRRAFCTSDEKGKYVLNFQS